MDWELNGMNNEILNVETGESSEGCDEYWFIYLQ